MEGFNYARHSHEEYAFGITLSGKQVFFSQGEYHQSNAGDVILFNPEDIHDGNSGGDQALNYFMLYIPEQKLRKCLEGAGLPGKQEVRLSDAVVKHTQLRDSLLNLALNICDGKTDLFEQEDGLDALFGMIRDGLPERLYETGYALACDVAAADGTLAETELRLLEEIRYELNIDRLHAAAIERGARARHVV